MDVARLNFSHGSYEFYAELIGTIRSLNKELGSTPPSSPTCKAPKCAWAKWRTMARSPMDSELVITTEPVKGRPGLGEHDLYPVPAGCEEGRDWYCWTMANCAWR
jgi:hypothetical protein